MMEAKEIIVHPVDEREMSVITAFFKALNIKFELQQRASYNPEMVKKILVGQEDISNGKGVVMTVDELEKLCK